MTRADGEITKVHYRGQEDDFVIMVEGPEPVKRWKDDKSIPLVDVVNSFDIFVTHKHGAQGQLDRASKSMLENEFGTKNEEDVVRKILEQGDVQEQKGKAKQGDRNLANGPGVSIGAPIHN